MNLFKTLPLSPRVSTAVLLLRLFAGVAFLFHGWGKIQNPTGWMGANSTIPSVFLALAAISEFGGGIAWILGLLTPLASFGMLCTMAVATYMHAAVFGDPFVGKGPSGGSYELALLYFFISIVFIITGPGRLSLDHLIFGEKNTG